MTKETAHIVEYLVQNKNVLKASFRSKPHCIEQLHSVILFMIHFFRNYSQKNHYY